MCKLERFKGDLNPQPPISLLSCTQPLRLKCDLLEGVMNLEMEYEAATMSLEGLSTLSTNSGEEDLLFSPLDLDGFKMAIDMGSSLRDL